MITFKQKMVKKLFPDRIGLVDGHKSEEEIHNTIWEELVRRDYFNEKK